MCQGRRRIGRETMENGERESGEKEREKGEKSEEKKYVEEERERERKGTGRKKRLDREREEKWLVSSFPICWSGICPREKLVLFWEIR